MEHECEGFHFVVTVAWKGGIRYLVARVSRGDHKGKTIAVTPGPEITEIMLLIGIKRFQDRN